MWVGASVLVESKRRESWRLAKGCDIPLVRGCIFMFFPQKGEMISQFVAANYSDDSPYFQAMTEVYEKVRGPET